MLTMQQKVFVGVVLLFAFVLAASILIAAEIDSYEIKLVTTPDEDQFFVPEGKEFSVTCEGKVGSNREFSSINWLNAKGALIPEGIPGTQKVGKNSLMLTFSDPKPEDSGIYKCIADYNTRYTLEKSVQITFYGNETNGNGSFIVNVEVGNVTTNSVRFHISASGSPDFIEARYKENRATRTLTKRWDYGDDYELNDLVPGGKYSFQFQTRPQRDQYMWSKEYEVILLPVAPEIILQQLEGRKIQLGWSRWVDDIMRGTIDSYELKYFTVQMNKGNEWIARERDCAITVEIPSCAGTTHTISDLQSSGYYELQLRAHTASGYGEIATQRVYIP